MAPNEREMQVAAVIEEFKRDKLTGKIELHFKSGVLTAGNKQVIILT